MDFAAAFTRDPQAAPYPVRCDATAALVFAVLAGVLAFTVDDGRRPDLVGWALLGAAHVPLAWRRKAPLPVLLAVVACVAPYHALDYMHLAPIPASMTALYTVAATGRPQRTVIVGLAVTSVTLTMQLFANPHEMVELLRVSGWVIAMLVFGASIRLYRQLVAGVVERAEGEAERKVVEERLRIARDLHDLLAHSITLIGVQTSVAAHVLVAAPDRLDREALARALDEIAETCREARAEVRTTLDVLRAAPEGPLPDLASLPDLVRASGADLIMRTGNPAETGTGMGTEAGAGAGTEGGAGNGLGVGSGMARVPAAVGAAAYRIVQESLTNAVRHGGRGAGVRVDVGLVEDVLTVRVTNGGAAGGSGEAGGPGGVGDPGAAGVGGMGGVGGLGSGGAGGGGGAGYGIIGMRERARSVGGTLRAGPRAGGGFEVSAELPLTVREVAV
ncbi:sensor histidine kinase [Streptomyces sp. WAC01280]|uniref:sensor histidine kinase n=1 Tax=Streptomyces sp. WAC01280 TaxID=2487424 RepID=UPI000F799E6C|nr:histidine kinase [Streptomyces sp. WAC01280]RSS58434.1 sensor histidine kinase [Streptomyces sp. WAC01280]